MFVFKKITTIMKNFLIIILLCLSLKGVAQKDDLNIIPQPLELEQKPGYFVISPKTTIFLNSRCNLDFEANYLNDLLAFKNGAKLKIASNKGKVVGSIVLECKNSDPTSEMYSLNINDHGIRISANGKTGLFYGIQTFSQLLLSSEINQNGISLPFVHIEDSPRYNYRALMLDPARHFLPIEGLKKYIDVMSMYKFNHLHLHLSDDQGWRIEIEKYPLLTKIGSYRSETEGNGQPHTGYYTKDELKQLVQYAMKRGITIIPEIDIPGHNLAAVASYPNLTCFEGGQKVMTVPGVSKELLCAGNEQVFEFLDVVFGELSEVFPAQKVHIGGDEAPLDHWKECPKCQARKSALGMQDNHDLMSYFFKRVGKILDKYNKEPLVWYEIDVPEYPSNSTMYSWRMGLSDQVIQNTRKEGYGLICSPGEHAYFDYPQWKGEETCDWMPILSLEKVYQFDPGYGLPDEEQSHILGVEATLWGEYVKDIDRAFYMTWPRALALSEAGWSIMPNRSWKLFQERLILHLKRFDEMGINYRKPAELGEQFNK
jgi:hexosaminidase